MGAFNTVETSSACLGCGNAVRVEVQFKYGEVWQHAYAVGDRIVWGGNAVGEPGAHQVAADGVAELRCANCGHHEDVDYYVWVIDGQIAAVQVADGRFAFSSTGDRYAVLDRS